MRLLLGGLCALALATPAQGLGAEGAATTPASPASETSSPASASEAPPTPTTTSTGESAPPTVGQPVAPVATIPQVQAQHAQSSTPGGSGNTPGGSVGSAHARARSTGGANGGSTPSSPAERTRAGKPAPAPSALTPPLGLAFSSSLAGVPSFFIESFRVPPFLLPIYQAAGTAYGVPWQVLAAINEVETDYGRDLSVSSAGAEGWMQFLPSSWATYGVDANGDGFKDPYNPADAIFAAARYLRAAGAATDLRGAVYAYNHSHAYVESVMLRAKLLGGTPSELLGAITGLTESRFPVHAPSHFSDGFPTVAVSGSSTPTTIAATTIYSELGAPVIAVQDGEIVQIGDSPELGRFISLRDAYGNTYTYARLASVAALYPVLEPHSDAPASSPTGAGGEAPEPRPTGPASAGTQPSTQAAAPTQPITPASAPAQAGTASAAGTPAGAPAPAIEAASLSGLSLGAATRPGSSAPPSSFGEATGSSPASSAAAGAPPAPGPPAPTSSAATPRVFRAGPNDVYLHRLRRGAMVIAGTVLGHVGSGTSRAGGAASEGGQPHMLFQIRPAGVGAPLIDPKPILDGWVALENSSIFRAKGQNPFLAGAPTLGQVLLESKEQLEQQVLENRGISMRACGHQEVQTGQIDRRVLATLEFLALSGLRPTVSALKCGHLDTVKEGGVSAQSSGNAVDISQVNGIPVAGHQGPGSIADVTIRKLLTLQGSMKPHQIISLMSYPGTDNTLAMADHRDHIQVAFEAPFAERARLAGAFSSAITPEVWIKLIARLGEIPNPTVASGPSAASIPDHPGPPTAGGKEPGGNG
jgi:Transglycosylase SLT domain